MNVPTQILLQAFMERITPTLREMRSEGWPIETTVQAAEDGTAIVQVTSALSMNLVPIESHPQPTESDR